MVKQIHITLSEKAAKQLEDLKNKLNLNSVSDVIRSSIALQKYIEDQKEEGKDFILKDPRTNKEQIIVNVR